MAKTTIITTNDTFSIPVEASWGSYQMALHGTDGGAVFEIQLNGTDIGGAVVTVPFTQVINAGQGTNYDLLVTGGTGIDLTLTTGKVR